MWRRMTTPFVIVVVGAAARSLAIISSELKTWTRSLNSLGSGQRWCCWQQRSRGGQQRQRRRTKINTTPAQIQPGKSASSIETKMMMIKEDTNWTELYMIFSRLKSMMLKKCLKSSHKSATYATYQGGCVTVTEFCCDFLEIQWFSSFVQWVWKLGKNVSSEFSRRK